MRELVETASAGGPLEGLLGALAAGLLGAPLLGVAALTVPFLADRSLDEDGVHRVTRVVAGLHLLLALVLAGLTLALGPHTLDLGRWYGDAQYALELRLRLDGMTTAAALVVAVIGLVVLRFSERYLHREDGHLRFFATTLLALSCLDLVALAHELPVLFIGWELLGLTSFLLIAFFHERDEAVARGLRAIFSYRTADLGLLLTLILLHAEHSSDALGGDPRTSGLMATTIGLLLLFTAAGKAGLVPFSSWLARATEGPTPSTALFYAGLSVHTAPWLLLRAWPLYGESMVARVALVSLGLVSALSAAAHARTRSDVKGAVVMAGCAQVGLIVAEIGLGLHALAGLHMVGNIGLRVWQLLRAPGVLQIQRRREALLAGTLPGPRSVPAWLWLWSSEGWFQPFVQGAVGLVTGASNLLERASRAVERLAIGGRDEREAR